MQARQLSKYSHFAFQTRRRDSLASDQELLFVSPAGLRNKALDGEAEVIRAEECQDEHIAEAEIIQSCMLVAGISVRTCDAFRRLHLDEAVTIVGAVYILARRCLRLCSCKLL